MVSCESDFRRGDGFFDKGRIDPFDLMQRIDVVGGYCRIEAFEILRGFGVEPVGSERFREF